MRPDEERSNEDRAWLIDAEVSDRPWRREEFPHVAAWLDVQQNYLDMIVAASKKPRFYSPLIRQGDAPLMTSTPALTLNAGRSAVQALIIRAFHHMGEKDFSRAWGDVIACRRLARLVAQGPMILDVVVGSTMDAAIFAADSAVLGCCSPNAEVWATSRAEFETLPALPLFSEKLDMGQRFAQLDAICVAARYGVPQIDKLFYGPDADRQAPSPLEGLVSAVDWNIVLRTTNEWMDRYVEAAQMVDPLDRSSTLTALDWEAQAIGNAASESRPFISAIVSQRVASDHMANVFVGIFYSSLTSSTLAEERNRAYRPLVRVGLALAHYNSENGSYPAKLAQLAPTYQKSIPRDPFAERSFRYRKTDDGYRLYSVGSNRRDDGGKGYNNVDDSDDLVIEVPWKSRQ